MYEFKNKPGNIKSMCTSCPSGEELAGTGKVSGPEQGGLWAFEELVCMVSVVGAQGLGSLQLGLHARITQHPLALLTHSNISTANQHDQGNCVNHH